ncbi:TonB-dependent receptor [Lutibacter sp. A64]|uniref:SusC/RagA family TonB-linked outer membrane protein n=1 Tax=Lutibacter sp. A64 TaxID=2918526 RepID=UPI001F054595|nr:TonB-dependent receptor [Lutibacter sp. A64]UMB54129.1 TonB-dependent receptor [Lutibacter sp. A64]
MKQNSKKQFSVSKLTLILAIVFSSFTAINLEAQNMISGVVTDDGGMPLPGVTVLQKGTTRGASTDFEGNYSIELTSGEKTLVFSYLGFKTVEIAVNNRTTINVSLVGDVESLEEVVLVGYGTQKKESVVGAITQVKGAELMEKAAGIANVEEALQGNLPGVTAIQGSGIPGQSDMQIFIRGQSSWNGSGGPLILVDGVKRSMTDVDMNDIEKLSVLKDASATAVFGVEGANGVILITTKRGQEGKAQLSLAVNSTIKFVSKLPEKLDSYDAIMQANSSILRELSVSPIGWGDFTPMDIADRYRNPGSVEESYRYPNINYEDELLKDFAQDYRVNLSVRGGNKSAKYFGSLAFQTVNDIFDGSKYDSGKGYLGEYKYERFNYRSNVDFKVTSTTELSVNLSGYLGTRESPSNLNTVVNGIYEIAPDLYTPVYPDGYYGQYIDDGFGISNPIVSLTNTGYDTYTNFQVNTDFILKQKLDFITEGLSLQGRFSLDNNMRSKQSLVDRGADGVENLIYRIYEGENETFLSPNGVNDFDFAVTPWTVGASDVEDNQRDRRMVYDVSMNYNQTFANKHNVTGLFLFRRQETAIGSVFPTFRENWVARATYDYDNRYFLDINGAYNGSEKFGPGFRFDLFPSAAAGWTVTNETFMEDVDWMNKLKVRGSYGLIGDDNFSGRWKYITQWSNGGAAFLVPSNYKGRSPYIYYTEKQVGNPNLQWETAIKYNIGAEIGLFNNSITAEFDYFAENRDNILITGSQRAVPDWFGAIPPDFNKGKVEVRGYEIVLGAKHTFENGVNLFGNFNFTQAKDEVIEREDPVFKPFYQKAAGYAIGQIRTAIPGEIMTNWDDIYMSTPQVTNQNLTRVGYYDVVDFDGDGIYNSSFDNAPYGYPVRPQRNWSATLGAKYKGFTVSAQLYGTQNALRSYGNRTFSNQTNLIFTQDLDYWTVNTPNNTDTQPAWRAQGATNPRDNYYDASLTRLKAVSLSYNIPAETCEKLGVKSLQIFVNGNNLILWTDLPDDREFNGTTTADSSFRGDYPTLKRFNFGFNMNF